MRYKTVLVHADLSRHAPERIALAADLCAEHGAHLIGAAMTGISREVLPNGYNVAPGSLLAGYFDPLEHAARQALDAFEAIAARRGVSYEPRLVCDDVADGLVLLARFADLLVVSQDDPAESLGYAAPAVRMPDHLVFHAARPVLVVPAAHAAQGCARRVLLCWNGSREAALAMAGALPLLQRATHTTLAWFAPAFPVDSASAQELADALAFLKRHGVHAEPVLRDPGHDTGHAILRLAAELDCDLVAMGCFGHSQFSELLLGGASRTVLREAALPVLMMH